MNDSISLESPAKVNLRLEILRKRQDGYHELRTIFQKISIRDTLRFSLRRKRGISIAADHPELSVGKDNLVYKAAQRMFEATQYTGGLDIEIEKRIPLGAGLGGGSSNAAATLRALNHLLGVEFPEKQLEGMGLELGADVPFFFFEGSAIGSGIGERLKTVKLPDLWYVLIYPNFQVSTRWAYDNFVLTRSTENEKRGSGSALSMEEALNRDRRTVRPGQRLTKKPFHLNLHSLVKTPQGISRILLNHLEQVVSRRYPEIGVMKEALVSVGALGALMTGSGPTVFGLFDKESSSTAAYEKVRMKARKNGWVVFKAHSL